MSDDEFGFDDTAFDAADFAKIDEIEQKYASIATQGQPPKPAPTLPVRPTQADRVIHPIPAKRFRSNQWTRDSIPRRHVQENTNSDDETPPSFNVIATKDGKYHAIDPNSGSTFTVHSTTPSALPGLPTTSDSSNQRAVLPQRRVEQTPTPQNFQSWKVLNDGNASNSRFTAITSALKETTVKDNIEDELTKLRTEVERLRKRQEEAESQLRAAKEDKWTKEGEIGTMRRNMAKMSASHSETLAKVQAEKVAAEEKRKQHERRMNQEMERLRSSLALRRQELETSVRKTPWSIRKQNSSGMAPIPARNREFSRSSVNETPIRPSQSSIPPKSEEKNRIEATFSKKGKGKDRAPGFASLVDSFQNHSPVKMQAISGKDGNVRSKRSASSMDEMFPPIVPPPFLRLEASAPPSSNARTMVQPVPEPDDTSCQHSLQQAASQRELPVAMWGDDAPELDLVFEPEEETQDANTAVEDMVLQEEEIEPLETTDMKDYCLRLLFSHTSPPFYQYTLQILLSTPIPHEPPGISAQYIRSSSSLIEALGSILFDYETTIRRILIALQEMALTLSQTAILVSLAGLLNLFATMCLFLSEAALILLQVQGDEVPPLLSVLVEILERYAISDLTPYNEEQELLLKEALNLFDVLCLTTPKELIHQMRFLLQGRDILSGLLNDRQPLWVYRITLRGLATICTYQDQFGLVLAFPVPTLEKEDQQDPSRIPVLERMAQLLVESKAAKNSRDHNSLRVLVLTCLTQLAIASTDALKILAASQTLVPALVASLSRCTDLVWDGDEMGLDNAVVVGTLEIIHGILQLLHYLVFKGDSEMDFQRKLQYPPPRYNGLEHLFVVGLGRLSYADPPEWESKAAKDLAEASAELARDLLEHVVDGPEVDTIWASYQGAGGSQDAQDEEGEDGMDILQVAASDEEDMDLV